MEDKTERESDNERKKETWGKNSEKERVKIDKDVEETKEEVSCFSVEEQTDNATVRAENPEGTTRRPDIYSMETETN